MVEVLHLNIPHLLLGSWLSPFAVKLKFLCDYSGLPVRFLPADGSTWLNLRIQARRWALVHGLRQLTHSTLTPLDELPLVPFLFGPRGQSFYDSSAIGRYLHAHPPATPAVALLPTAAVPRWICGLVDEAFDELGLYLLHHQRWVRSARSTQAPELAGREFASLVPMALRGFAQQHFAARQVRRLPYLFSVAPPGFTVKGVSRRRQPPSRPGFPPTHQLLDELFARWMGALEYALTHSPFLFGAAPTLADAAVYGMVASLSRIDLESAAWLRTQAPVVTNWAAELTAGRYPRTPIAPLPQTVPESLIPLVVAIADSFVPLMRQNEAAYERAHAAGQRRFNEAAFDAGEALYDGVLAGHPYRAVVKTFQVRVVRALRDELRGLTEPDRRTALALAPGLDGLFLRYDEN